jgi:uracil-DNA glycosylase family 4
MICTRCRLHKTRTTITAGRGSSPASVLFIFPAPDQGGDQIGKVCAGRTNLFLTDLVQDAARTAEVPTPSFYVTSMVLCYPPHRDPEKEEIISCRGNLMDTVKRIEPTLIVFVSKEVDRFYRKEFRESITIIHPEILMKQGGKASPWYLTTARVLTEAFLIFKTNQDG